MAIRILVADDFVAWRNFVSSIVQEQPEWHVVCETSDGLEAVQKTEEFKPDLILLDIGLPKLNGIEAARKIRKLVPESKILFLSAIGSSDVAREALNTGAKGYVVKADAGSELVTAVAAVFRGEQFVSRSLRDHLSDGEDTQVNNTGPNVVPASASAMPRKLEGACCHKVQFYYDEAVVLKRATQFLAAALIAGNPAMVIATESHRNGLHQRLKAQGVDVDACIRDGKCVLVDAADTLSTFLIDGWPDPVRFLEGFRSLLEGVSRKSKIEDPRVAIFGEGVALLWAKGKRDAAIRVEQLCNDLTREFDVDILCAYPVSGFHAEEDKQAFETICAEHSTVYSP